jgi:rare lipoprotein A
MIFSRLAATGLSIAFSVMLMSCASTPRFAEKETHTRSEEGRTKDEKKPKEDSKGRDDQRSKAASGKTLLSLEGVVSYYAHDFNGKMTSNGETFDMNDLTAAHRTFPFGTQVRVTNLENGKSVMIRVNDRGPFVEGRIMDLSMGAAKEIDLIKTGTTRARLDVVRWGDGK